MERLFFSITRWIMLIGAALAFVFLVLAGIYVAGLYVKSQDTEAKTIQPYAKKDPVVDFSRFEAMHKENIERQKGIRQRRISYIESIIINGSEGHGYDISKMPAGLIKGEKVNKVAVYVADGMKGERPVEFGACIACHSGDGKESKRAPGLLDLPIYNGARPLVNISTTKNAPAKLTPSGTQYMSPLEKYSAKIAGKINMYAIQVDQNGTTVKDMHNFFLKKNDKYNSETFSIYTSQINIMLDQLLKYAKTLNKQKNELKNAIDWRVLIEWFNNEFDLFIANEDALLQQSLAKIEAAKSKKLSEAYAAKAEMVQVLIAIGISLAIFILLTMILVLFQIEINTRYKNEEASA